MRNKSVLIQFPGLGFSLHEIAETRNVVMKKEYKDEDCWVMTFVDCITPSEVADQLRGASKLLALV